MAKKTISYRLATAAGYKANIVNIGTEVYDPLSYYNKENFPDVEITRPGIATDLSLLHTKCLMTVNGYVYPTEYTNNRLYIRNATKCMLRSRDNSIGILSFNQLNAPLTKIAITPSMVSVEPLTPMYEKAIITFDREIGHPILVIGGYLIFEHPEFFYRVSGTSFALRLDRLNYIEKLYEIQRQRDIFNELGIPTSTVNPSLIDATVARSDISITKFLTSFNSFMIELPVTNFTTRKIYLEHSNLPGNFRTEIEPTLPIIVGYGKIAEYFKKKTTEDKYNIYINDAYYNQHIFSYLNNDQIKLYNDHRRPGNTYRLSEAFFLEMSTEQT